jgi:hypothetical protein
MKYTAYVDKEFKRCLGKGCTNSGKNPLRIIYLGKTGIFCDICSRDLLSLGLASSSYQRNEEPHTGPQNLVDNIQNLKGHHHVQLK